MGELEQAARIAVRNCLAVREGEKVVVITDRPQRPIAELLWEECSSIGTDAILVEITPRSSHGEEPPEPLPGLMMEADVLIIPTSKSMSHTKARREACKAGARCVTLPGIREETFRRALNADYTQIAELSRKLADLLSQGEEAEVLTPAGTSIRMSLQGRAGYADTGLVHKPGDFSNLPAGEAYVAPVEGSAEGVIVVDGAIADEREMEEPVRIPVKRGCAEGIRGGKLAERLENLIEPFGQPARNIAELGIGTNPKAQLIGSVLEDEKVLGTVHIALGDNITMGGKVKVSSHLDGILLKPTLKVDGKVIIEDGVLKI